jgi:Reverse transcriptase (RNA-dependent DNA polymerase)/GAG-pre-integrase domain
MYGTRVRVTHNSRQDVEVLFDGSGCRLLDRRAGGEQLGFGKKRADVLCQLVTKAVGKSPRQAAMAAVGVGGEETRETGIDIFHRRLGHISKQAIKDMVRDKTVTGMDLSEACETVDCHDCAVGKQTRKSFKGRLKTAEAGGDVIHSDVCRPLENTSWGGSRYFVSFIDEYTRTVKVALIAKKSRVTTEFERFQAHFEKENKSVIRRVHSDRGGVYQGLSKYLDRVGIKMKMTAAYCPEANRIAERMNRILLERVRAMLGVANLSKRFWGEALQYAVYVHNRIPTTTKEFWGTPYARLTGRVPSLEEFRIFGCRAYVHIPRQKRRKLDNRSWHGIFVGIGGYDTDRVYDPSTSKVEIVRNVHFNETIFPGRELDGSDPNEVVSTGDDDMPELVEIDTDSADSDPGADDDEDPDQAENETEDENDDAYEEDTSNSSKGDGDDADYHQDDEKEDDLNMTSSEEGDSDLPRFDNIGDAAYDGDDNADEEDDASVEPRYPRWQRRQARVWSMTSAVAEREASDTPTVQEALKSGQRADWVSAIQEELTSLEDKRTWDLIDLPHGARALPNKMVLRVKRNEDGSIERYKAHLNFLGNLQNVGIDFDETFAPVVDFSTVRMMLAIAAKERLHVHHMDVKMAFLNGDLEEQVYMMQPKYFERVGAEHKV